jgi:DNA-binding transcriptional LysR family regulator
MPNIRTKDLNLLSVFVVVAEEANLSRASERLGLSQPALSHSLAKLREEFSDPLFVRSQRGLTPTPRVAELLPQVRELLRVAERLYDAGNDFDPSKEDRHVRFALTTYAEVLLMKPLMAKLRKEAPKLKLETRALHEGLPKRELESGEIDVAIAAYFENLPESLRVKKLFADEFVCVCSKKNPYLKTKRKLADYLDATHLQIEVPPGVFAPIDRWLESKNRKRDIALRVGNFLTPPEVLLESSYLLTCPRGLAEHYVRLGALQIIDLPTELSPLETKMIWHEKNQKDPFHSWLRSVISEAGAFNFS